MGSNAHELGVPVGQWNATVRRARIGRDHKVAALTISSYADADGTGIRCSVPRLAVDLEVSYSTARRYLAWLREVGLIELTRPGNRRLGTANEYRLILGPDVLEHLEVLSPDEHKRLAEGIRESERDGTRERGQRLRTQDQRSSIVSVDRTPENGCTEADLRSPKVSVDNPDQRSNDTRSTLTLDEHPPSRTTPSHKDRPSRTDDEDVRTAVTGTRANPDPEPQSAVVVEIFPGAAQEAPYRPRPRWSTRGQDTIAEATARAAADREAERARREAT